jgi:predicted GNAT family acetyltransferase
MIVRTALKEDAEAACVVLRRSIIELCRADHRDDNATLAAWLANKTPENVRKWIGDANNYMLVADDDSALLGVAAVKSSGKITLNYVLPDARFRGVSKALVTGLEARALELGLEACALDSTGTARRFYFSIGYREAGTAAAGFGVSLAYPMAKQLLAK